MCCSSFYNSPLSCVENSSNQNRTTMSQFSSYWVEISSDSDLSATDQMEKVNLDYLLKCIPILSQFHYKKILVDKVENFLRRLRWKLFAIKYPDLMIEKETYGFKTNKVPPQFPELKQFEDDLFSLIKEIKFRSSQSETNSNTK